MVLAPKLKEDNMIPETLLKVLEDEGIVAIATKGGDFPHLVNTWNSYVTITDEGWLLIPASRMNVTENNVQKDSRILLTIGSRNVQGLRYMGTGFLIEGNAQFEDCGERFERMKKRFDWMRAVLLVKPEKITQTL